MMTRIVSGFVTGIMVAAWLDQPAALVAWTVLFAWSLWRRSAWPVAAALAGCAWFWWQVAEYRTLASQVDGELDLLGRVASLPRESENRLRFEFVVAGAGQPLERARLNLTWLEPAHSLSPGQYLRLAVRARPVVGLANPDQFDFETWAFSRGIHGTGYVRALQPLDALPTAAPLDRLRARISTELARHVDPGPARRLLPALAVADRRGLNEDDWAVFRATGTSHLLAISGLHVGLCAGLGFLLGRCLWRACPGLAPRRSVSLIPALLAAALYAALAGFSVPTVRALVMFSAVAAFWWFRSPVSLAKGLIFAAGLLLVVRVEAVADSGFWLSFGAVAALALGLHGRARGGRRHLFRAQFVVCIGLLPLTAQFGLGQSWVAPLVNLVAIPWLAFLVVPPLLCAALLVLSHPGIAAWPLDLAALCIDGLYRILAATAELAPPFALGSDTSLWLLMGAGLLLLPPGLPGRWLGILALLAGFLRGPDRPPAGAIDLHVLDVGQGLALILTTRQHVLLYDAGPRSRFGWDAGESIVAPFLERRGWQELDLAILSHGDLDHAGGFEAVRERIDVARTLSSVSGPHLEPCRAGQQWDWDGVVFRVLHPGPGLPYLGNDSSCVLLVSAGAGQFLLPGDATEVIEARLLDDLGRLQGLIAGHHGSRSSSSPGFVARTQPRWVVFSAGRDNRYGMPHADVLGRFAESRRLHTGYCGYLHLRMNEKGIRLLSFERRKRHRPWHPRVQDAAGENQYDCGER
ncbi:MAG: DNA internalization-related competence protein ComEC/Rec2 [Xanthomonadales bacterium]|nr:DNA internalization-related competence protein ComEC/Rec2 [Xanthomonadales bacterium]